MAVRTRLLLYIANTLMALAAKRELAVMVINQMTTKLGNGEGQYGQLIPALGGFSRSRRFKMSLLTQLFGRGIVGPLEHASDPSHPRREAGDPESDHR